MMRGDDGTDGVATNSSGATGRDLTIVAPTLDMDQGANILLGRSQDVIKAGGQETPAIPKREWRLKGSQGTDIQSSEDLFQVSWTRSPQEGLPFQDQYSAST